MKVPVVAVIDDQISRKHYPEELVFSIVVQANGVIREADVLLEQSNRTWVSHGTLCALVLKKYLPEAKVGSIVVEAFSLDCVVSALDWCLCNGIRFIQLSMGAIQPSSQEEGKLKKVIEGLWDAGCVIVAALSNNNKYTIPACLPHVINVCTSPSPMPAVRYIGSSFGIDFEAYAQIILDGAMQLQASNSLSVPIVMACLIKGKLKISSKGSDIPLYLGDYRTKRFSLTYPFQLTEYIRLASGRDKHVAPSLLKIRKQLMPSDVSSYCNEEAIIFSNNLLDDTNKVIELLDGFPYLRYCVFEGCVADEVRQVCIEKGVFFWEPQNYFYAVEHCCWNISGLDDTEKQCVVLYLTASDVQQCLTLALSLRNLFTNNDYTCRFIATERNYFLPGFDCCFEIVKMGAMVEAIDYFYGPSVIFVLGPTVGEEELASLSDLRVKMTDDSTEIQLSSGGASTIAIPRVWEEWMLEKTFKYIIQTFGGD